jgi:TonB family protein
MLRFFIISLTFNFFLFTLYGYWLSGVLKQTLEVKKFVLPPLKIKIIKVTEKANQSIGSKAKKIFSEKYSGRKYLGKRQKQPVELLTPLLKEVSKEVQVFRKIVTKTKAIYKGNKIQMLGSRKLIYVPPVYSLKVSYPPAPVEVKITILPDGRVVNAVLIKKSGNPKVDDFILSFVKNLKFEPVNKPVVQEMYISFVFKY